MTLDELILYARKNGITGDWDFTDIFIGLISNRPSVCAETMDRFADLRTLGIKTVYQEFKRSIQDSTRVDPSTSVTISLCREHESEESTLSLALLQAASVLLSLWTEGKESKAKQSSNGNNGSMADEEEASAAISDLASMLLYPIDANEGQLRDGDGRQGLASARIAGTEKSAVSVESVGFECICPPGRYS